MKKFLIMLIVVLLNGKFTTPYTWGVCPSMNQSNGRIPVEMRIHKNSVPSVSDRDNVCGDCMVTFDVDNCEIHFEVTPAESRTFFLLDRNNHIVLQSDLCSTPINAKGLLCGCYTLVIETPDCYYYGFIVIH